MSSYPRELKYTKEHEWARRDGNLLVVGITEHAQSSLGDVVYVELPRIGQDLAQGEPFGVVESTKAVSELFAPVSGKVVKVNEALLDSPELVNQEPHGGGWMIELEPKEPAQLDGLLDAEAYEQLAKSS